MAISAIFMPYLPGTREIAARLTLLQRLGVLTLPLHIRLVKSFKLLAAKFLNSLLKVTPLASWGLTALHEGMDLAALASLN